MTEDKLDKLNSLMGVPPGKKPKQTSRLGKSGEMFSQKEIKRATGAKASEGTTVVSFRVPDRIEKLAMEVAAEQRVPFAEFKKAIFYRGLQAFADGEEVPMDYGRTVTAAVPDIR